jgi:ribonuclease HI
VAVKPVLAELLRFIAANEDLPRTLARYKGYDRDVLGKLLNAAADRVDEAEAARAPAPGAGSKGIKVRKQTDVEKAAQRAAEEIDEAMELSKAERDQRRKERAAADEKERHAVEAAALAEQSKRTRLFTDGAARGNPGPAGAGAVILSPEGHIVAKIGKFLGDSTNNVAEYWGLILGLKRAKAMGIKELEVYSDSELLVKQLAGEYAVKADHLRPLHDEAKTLLQGFSFIQVRHIPREENTAADAMSNRAIDERL